MKSKLEAILSIILLFSIIITASFNWMAVAVRLVIVVSAFILLLCICLCAIKENKYICCDYCEDKECAQFYKSNK